MYTAAAVQVSLQKHNDNNILPVVYFSSLLCPLCLFKEEVNNNVFLGKALRCITGLCTNVTAFKFTQFLCVVFGV